MKSGGDSLLFIHIFCHKTMPYHFEQDDGWMAQNFFSGGTMPCHDLFLHFQQDVVLEQMWWLNGKHYAQTCEDWLKKQDANNKGGRAVKALRDDATEKGNDALEGEKTFYRFRVFYLACAEFFGELLRSNERQSTNSLRKSPINNCSLVFLCLLSIATRGGEEWGVGHYLFRKRD